MKRRFDFDGALKELFERDRPLLLEKLTGGIAVKAFLNVELPNFRHPDLAGNQDDPIS